MTPDSSGILYITSFLAVSSPQTVHSAGVQPSIRFEFPCCVPRLQSSQKLKVENKLIFFFLLSIPPSYCI